MSDEEEGNYREEVCDSCEGEGSDVIPCPSAWEDIGEPVLLQKCFCYNCCEEIFDNEGCESDVGNCDRATEIFKERLKKYASENGFS